MAERVELPRLPAGEPEQQLQEMYNYLYRMAEALNANLAEIGTADLTDAERQLMLSMSPNNGTDDGSSGYAWQEAETLKSLIIKTAQWVKNTLDSYRINLLGEYVAEGKFGKYVRNTRMDVDVTPTGTTQKFKFSEIIEDLKKYEINAKNYIKTGLLRTEQGLPVYGVAVGKDIVTFAEDGTETYNDGNKVGEFTADALSFYKGGTITAKYAGTETIFYVGGQIALKIQGNRIGFYNNGTEYMYLSGGKVYISDLNGYSTTSQTSQAIESAISAAIADKVTTTQLQQTASSVEAAAKQYTNGQLTNYSTTSQMATQIAQYVANNAYGLISGITIAAAGITMTGSKYISLQSSGYVDIGSWRFNSTGQHYLSNGTAILEFGRYADKSANATGGVYVADNIAYLFATVAYFSANYVAYGYGGDAGVAGPAFFPSHDVQVALGGSSRRWGNAYISTVYYGSLIQSSSRDIKHKIEEMPEMGERLDQLEPVTFIYDNDPDEKTRHGLIYEDTVDVMPEICTGDEGEKAINYVELIPMLLKEIKSLRRRVAQLENERS